MNTSPDLNLLVVLDALVTESSVTKAAKRLNLSPPATSRALGRLRAELHDEVLVRSGRGLTPTAKALALQKRVRRVVDEARDISQSDDSVDLSMVTRDFRIVANDAAICFTAGKILEITRKAAPNIRFAFVSEGMRDASLRDPAIDLELGLLQSVEPEVHVELLLQDRFVGVAKAGHPLTRGTVTLERYLEATHLLHSRYGSLYGTIDEALAKLGCSRRSVSSTPTVASSLFTLLNSDLVSTCLERLSRPAAAALGLMYFELPAEIAPEVSPASLSLAWHPRHDGDPVHAWFLSCVRDAMSGLE